MLFQINKKDTIISQHIPISYRKYAINNADTLLAVGDQGTIMLQEISRNGFRISYAVFDIRERTEVIPIITSPTLALHYLLQGSTIVCQLAGAGTVQLIPGKYNLFYLPQGQQTAQFEKGLHITFFIELSPVYLKKLETEHNDVEHLIARLNSSSDAGVMLPTGTINHECHIIRSDVLFSNKTGAALELELEAGILRLLSVYEGELSNNAAKSAGINIMEELKEYIINNISNPRLSTEAMSTLFHVSIRKLERDFKAYTGITMFEFFLAEKMKAAQSYVTKTNFSIKMISESLGYNDVSAFIRTFKKYFGISPLNMRH